MWLVTRAPLVPMGSLEIWTMTSWPSRTTSRIGVCLEMRDGSPFDERRPSRLPLR
jgi:hypothetical protein